MTIGYTIRKLKALKAAVLADGKIDWAETDELLAAASALAVLAALFASVTIVVFGVVSANRHHGLPSEIDDPVVESPE